MTDLRSIFAGSVVSTFNNGVVTDDTLETARSEHNQFVGDSSAFDPQTLKNMSILWQDDKLLMVPLFDAHVGGEGFQAERFKMVLNFIYDCRIAKTFFGGDLFDNANLAGKTNPLLSRLTPSKQFEYLLNMTEMKNCLDMGKVMFALYGNHDGQTNDRTKDANMSMVQDFARLVGIPYAPYNVLLKVHSQFGKEDVQANIFATHGSSKTMEPAIACESERAKMANAMCAAKLDPSIVDMICFGHLHIDGDIPTLVSTPVYDENGKLVADKTKTLHTLCEPPMQGMNDFAIRANMKTFGTNAYATEISWTTNPRYKLNKDTEFPYVLNINRFPILQKDKNAYTVWAQDYLTNPLYREPHEIRAQLEEKYLNSNQSLVKDYPNLIEGI